LMVARVAVSRPRPLGVVVTGPTVEGKGIGDAEKEDRVPLPAATLEL
jgi:hypothetical protein